MRIALIFCATCLVTLCVGSTTTNSAEPGDVRVTAASTTAQRQAAERGLAALQALVATAPNVGLGFAKPEDVRRAKLETPLRVYLVRLDALQAMNDRTPLSSLLLDARRTLYPVTVDGRVVSGLFAQENNGTWTVQQFGEAALARTSDAHRRSVNDILVWIPAAKLYFVGSGTGNALTLTPLVNDPRFGFAVDQNMPARAVLERVAHAMADYNGLPQ